MASSSSMSHCCQCKVETVELRNGWTLLDGGFSKLCEACCSEYEKGTFCQTFHLDSDGWRDCRICGKLIHCGCRMSCHLYDTMDFGGVACITCSTQAFGSEPDRYPSPTATSEVSLDLWNSSGAECTSDAGEVKSGTGESPNYSMNPLPSNKTALQPVSDDLKSHAAQFSESNRNRPGTHFDPAVGSQRSLSNFSIHCVSPNEKALQSVSPEQPSPAVKLDGQTKSAAMAAFLAENQSLLSDFSVHHNHALYNEIVLKSASLGKPREVSSPVAQSYKLNKNNANAHFYLFVGGESALPDLSPLPNKTNLESVSCGQSYSAVRFYEHNKTGAEAPFFPFIKNEGPLSKLSVDNALPNKAPLQDVPCGQPIQIPSPLSRVSDPGKTPASEISIRSPSRSENKFQSFFHGEPSQVPPPVAQTAVQNTSPSTGEVAALVPSVRNQISQGNTSAKPTLYRLFEKSLSPTDAERKLARLVLPKMKARVFFPPILEGHQQPIVIQDSMGKNWWFSYRSWRNGNSHMYVLDGIRRYMELMDWEAGDIVTFYRLEPEGKLVIETRKGPSILPPLKFVTSP